MIEELIADFEADAPLFVGDVRERFSASGVAIGYRLLLPDGVSEKRGLIPVPPGLPEGIGRTILHNYLRAELYNLLTTLGGRELELSVGGKAASFRELLEGVINEFQLDRSRAERTGVARVVNVIERMMEASSGAAFGAQAQSSGGAFRILVSDAPAAADQPSLRFSASGTDIFRAVTQNLDGKIVCGLDVGGTDIKAALVVNGEIVALKEHDWNPGALKNVEEIIDPILDTIRVLNAFAVFGERSSRGENVEAELARCRALLGREVSPATLHADARSLEQAVGTSILDGIGLSFPDVVVGNKVVGGEVPKTLGMRSNHARDFETQFAELGRLDERLQELCKPGGVVLNTNDGPMAAFTAAVEIAAGPDADAVSEGVFAHTLGTDLGTGLVLADGSIPHIPLEVYNLILDIGSASAVELPAEDVRSLRNTNTGVAGTMQRFTSQTGAFRLAQRYFAAKAPELLEQAAKFGFLSTQKSEGAETISVPESPDDMRKAYLSHLMELATKSDVAAEIFRDIGEFLARVWRETERTLGTGLSARFLFGRLVKVPRCFELMVEGARRVEPKVQLLAADSSLANTPLMKQLDRMEAFTVAQFGQAIGAVYFVAAGL